jgi:hypothetical protein
MFDEDLSEFKELFQQKMASQNSMEAVLKQKIPEVLGIPIPGCTFEAEGVEYLMLGGYDQVPGYAMCVPTSEEGGSERKVIEPVLIYLPEAVELAQELADNPLILFQKLSMLVDDDDLPEDLREELAGLKPVLDMFNS